MNKVSEVLCKFGPLPSLLREWRVGHPIGTARKMTEQGFQGGLRFPVLKAWARSSAWVWLLLPSEQISTSHSNYLLNYHIDFINIPYYHGVCLPRPSPSHPQPNLAIPFVLTTIHFAFPVTPFF